MNRVKIEEHHDLCRHKYVAWVVIEETDPPKLLHAGTVEVTVSPFAALSKSPTIVDISHNLARTACQFPSEQDAYAEALFQLGKIAGGWGTRREQEAERLQMQGRAESRASDSLF